MTIAVEYLAEQSTAEFRTDGATVVERYLVTNLTGAASARKYAAAFDAGLPALYAAHPDIPNVFVVAKRPTSADGSGNMMYVDVEYRSPSADGEDRQPSEQDQGIIEVGGTVQIETTTTDASGAPMVIEHTYVPETTTDEDMGKVLFNQDRMVREFYTPLGLQAPEDLRSIPLTTHQRVTAEVYRPATIARATRVESRNPLQKSIQFRGKVNGLPIWGSPARTWLCTELRGLSSDGGQTYTVQYEFTLNPRTWDFAADFISAATNEPVRYRDGTAPPPTLLQVYEEANFAALGLDF